MFLEGQVDRQTDKRVHRRLMPKQFPTDFIGGKPVLSTGYLVSSSRTQRSASGEARTRNPSISGQALYHDCAPQLGSILCRYDTCPTQYAPDLRGSILCMQGTQYAPRESILCMEHFVALHCTYLTSNCKIKMYEQWMIWYDALWPEHMTKFIWAIILCSENKTWPIELLWKDILRDRKSSVDVQNDNSSWLSILNTGTFTLEFPLLFITAEWS